MKPEFVLNGYRTVTLEAFYSGIGQGLLAGQPWGESLDALDEILSGNYGLLPPTFRLIYRSVLQVRSNNSNESVGQLI